MNRRTLLLMAGAGLVALFYVGDMAYRSLIEEPMKRDEAQLDKLKKNLVKAQDAQLEAKKAGRKLEAYLEHSLPADPELARSAYQDWLLKLVQTRGLENASVDPGQPTPVAVKSRRNKSKRRLVYYRLKFGLQAKGSLEQVSQFMFDFYEAGHLHQIKSISLNPIGRGESVSLSLAIEAIALADCEREAELTESTLNRLAYENPTDYGFISQRNFFARGFSKALSQVELSAVTYDRNGDPQAWFRVGESRTTQIAKPGEKLDVELYLIGLVDVQADRAVLEVDGQVVRLRVGQTVGQALELQRAGETVSN